VEELRGVGGARRHQAAVVLFNATFRRGVIELPEWADLRAWLEKTELPRARHLLIRLVGDGLERRRYSHVEARPMLTALVGRDSDARRELVELLSKWGVEEDADELLRLAFTPPIDPISLAKVSNFVRSHRRMSSPLPFPLALRFVADFATRLRRTSVQTRRNTAARWRRAMIELVARADLPGQLELLEYLPQLEEHFAANLVLRFEPWRYPEVQARLNQMVNWGSLDGQLRRNIRIVVARNTRS
jgi:hypothetical protein